jgi:hypothetical protein
MITNPLVQKYLEGTLPGPMVGALLGGSLPVPPLELLQALSHAIFSGGPHQTRAEDTLMGFPESQLQSAILGPVDPPDALGLIASYRKEPALVELALLHENFNALWMERVVPRLSAEGLDIALNNQVFWIERPAILDLIEGHPDGDYNLKRRINEFRRDVLHLISEEVAQDRIEIIDAVESGHLDRAWAELPLPAADPELDAVVEETQPPPPLTEMAKALQITEGGNEARFMSVSARIMKLKHNQKAVLAQKGGKEERVHLIREANRMIQVAVVRNPRITEQEIQYIASMRSINEEVLRIIGSSREFMRKYQVVKSLVQNPKTPLALSLNHLKRLNDFDLRQMAHDRNIAELLRREAGRAMTARITK